MGEHKPTKGTKKRGSTRREFVKTAVAGAVGVTVGYQQIFAKDGAIHALEKARAEKVVRFLGITGHADPFVLARCL